MAPLRPPALEPLRAAGRRATGDRRRSGGPQRTASVLIAALAGCAALDDVRPRDGQHSGGVAADYEFPFATVLQIAREAADEVRLTIREEGPGGSYLLADDTAAYARHGEFVGIYLKSKGPRRTRVTVSARVPLFPLLKVGRADFPAELHRRLREKLALR